MMNAKSLTIVLGVAVVVVAGTLTMTGVLKTTENPTKAALLEPVEYLVATVDIYGQVIENDPVFRKSLARPSQDKEARSRDLARDAMRKSVNLVGQGSYEPELQGKIDRMVDAGEVMASLEWIRGQYETLQAGKKHYSKECLELLEQLGMALDTADKLTEVALDPGGYGTFADSYSLAKVLLMRELESYVEGVAALPEKENPAADPAFRERLEQFRQASADFSLTPVAASWEK